MKLTWIMKVTSVTWVTKVNEVTEITWVTSVTGNMSIEGNKGNVTLIFSSISTYLETDMLLSLPMLHLISIVATRMQYVVVIKCLNCLLNATLCCFNVDTNDQRREDEPQGKATINLNVF